MTTKRQVFYSFHYQPDNWRVSQIRNIGAIERNKPASDNAWEDVKKQGDKAIKAWIDRSMFHRTCTIVLVGSNTANRKWINYEIEKSWNNGMGVVGIYIHRLKNSDGYTPDKGRNPFDCINYGKTGKKLSQIVRCYNPQGSNSKEKYDWISQHLSNAIEEAIRIRNKYDYVDNL